MMRDIPAGRRSAGLRYGAQIGRLFLPARCPSLPINLLWARSPHVSPKVRAVIDAVKEWYGFAYPWDEGGVEAL